MESKSMREVYLDIITKTINDEERVKVKRVLEKRKNRDVMDIGIEDIPDCFGFLMDRDPNCDICILRRICRKSVLEITIPFALNFLKGCTATEIAPFKNLGYEIFCKSGIDRVIDKVIDKVEEPKINKSLKVKKKKKKIMEQGLKSKLKKPKEILPESTLKTVDLDEFGIKVNTKYSKCAKWLKENQNLETVVQKFREEFKDEGLTDIAIKRQLGQVAFFLRQKGFDVRFMKGKIIWKKIKDEDTNR